MTVRELITVLTHCDSTGDTNVEVTSIESDSRKITPGALFIAVKGFTEDGNRYIEDAVRKGAVAVLTDVPLARNDVVVAAVPDIRKAMALVADQFYGNPKKELVMTAVTGTNGKTTTTNMVKSIFDTGGMNCGLIGTVRHIVGSEIVESVHTTPEALDIHSMLARMVKSGQSACVMEVSSHALALSRVYGIQFRAAAYLNLTRDHLDFHEDMEGYLNAKSLLFSDLSGDSTAVVNRDDPYAEHIISVSRGAHLVTFGAGERCDIHPLSVNLYTERSEVILSTPLGSIECTLSLPGRFNVWNAMAAVGIASACGFPNDIIRKGLEAATSVRGRFEMVNEGQEFTVIVDYAHTPDALEHVLTSARELAPSRLISVFGCGGDRDKGKRPLMGDISTRIADYSIITSDNPRTEDPVAIIKDIMRGVTLSGKCEVLPDREEAIGKALSIARKGDIVIIAGKGHESYQIIGNKKIHSDDVEIARRILRTLKT